MNRPHVRRLVTGLVATATTATLGALVACGGGAHPSAADDDPFVSTDGGKDVEVSNGTVQFDVDVAKGITFGDEGLVSCGTQAGERTFTITNRSSRIVNYKIELTAGNDYYKVTPADGGIPVGSSATIKVTPNPIPDESEVTQDLYAGTLSISFPQLGVPPTIIRLHQTARGAIVTTTAGDSINLGEVQVGKESTVPLTLTNSGNAEATATLKLGTSVFTVAGEAQAVVKLAPNGGSESRELKLAPTIASDLTDTLTLSYGSAVFCKPPPDKITLNGKGTTSVGVSPGSLDFGLVNCGTTASPQTVTISSTVAMSFKAVLTKGGTSPFILMNDANGDPINSEDVDVPAASSFKLRVVPKKMADVSSTTDNAFGDTLTITTTGVTGDAPHVVNLRQTAKGAILAFDLASVTLSTPVGTNVNTNFALRNLGNEQVPYSITTDPASTFTSTLTTGNAVVGDTKGVLISKPPQASGTTISGTMKVALGAAGGTLCADLPPPMPLSITGTGSAITINPTNLNFGLVNCGDQAPPAQFFTISATVANNVKLSLGKGPSSQFFLAEDQAGSQPIANNTSVPVAPGSPHTVWVVPIKIPVPSKTDNNFYGDVITLTSDIPGETPRTVPATLGASGSSLSFPSNVKVGGTLTIANQGNANADFNVTGPVAPNGDISLTPGATIAVTAIAEGTMTVSNTNANVCGNTGIATITK